MLKLKYLNPSYFSARVDHHENQNLRLDLHSFDKNCVHLSPLRSNIHHASHEKLSWWGQVYILELHTTHFRPLERPCNSRAIRPGPTPKRCPPYHRGLELYFLLGSCRPQKILVDNHRSPLDHKTAPHLPKGKPLLGHHLSQQTPILLHSGASRRPILQRCSAGTS